MNYYQAIALRASNFKIVSSLNNKIASLLNNKKLLTSNQEKAQLVVNNSNKIFARMMVMMRIQKFSKAIFLLNKNKIRY